MWTAGRRHWWPLPNGLKWLPVPATSRGLGAFCCLGSLLCCCLGNKLRWGVYFDDIVNLQDLPVRLGQESFGSLWLGWCRDIDLNGISINYQLPITPSPRANWLADTGPAEASSQQKVELFQATLQNQFVDKSWLKVDFEASNFVKLFWSKQLSINFLWPITPKILKTGCEVDSKS